MKKKNTKAPTRAKTLPVNGDKHGRPIVVGSLIETGSGIEHVEVIKGGAIISNPLSAEPDNGRRSAWVAADVELVASAPRNPDVSFVVHETIAILARLEQLIQDCTDAAERWPIDDFSRRRLRDEFCKELRNVDRCALWDVIGRHVLPSDLETTPAIQMLFIPYLDRVAPWPPRSSDGDPTTPDGDQCLSLEQAVMRANIDASELKKMYADAMVHCLSAEDAETLGIAKAGGK